MTRLTLEVPGMKCDGCADSVREALQGVGGVERVEVSVDRGEARVRVDQGTPEGALATAVENAGYGVESTV